MHEIYGDLNLENTKASEVIDRHGPADDNEWRYERERVRVIASELIEKYFGGEHDCRKKENRQQGCPACTKWNLLDELLADW